MKKLPRCVATTIFPWGKYRYKKLPMGLASRAPDIFQDARRLSLPQQPMLQKNNRKIGSRLSRYESFVESRTRNLRYCFLLTFLEESISSIATVIIIICCVSQSVNIYQIIPCHNIISDPIQSASVSSSFNTYLY